MTSKYVEMRHQLAYFIYKMLFYTLKNISVNIRISTQIFDKNIYKVDIHKIMYKLSDSNLYTQLLEPQWHFVSVISQIGKHDQIMFYLVRNSISYNSFKLARAVDKYMYKLYLKTTAQADTSVSHLFTQLSETDNH